MYYFLTHSSINTHLGSIHLLVVINNVAMNTEVCISFPIEFSPDNMPRSGIAQSYGGSVFSF